ncbi:uncharacterized protein LOC132719015, partial [Ruditapes philippinarum]|uniref:uncharacterized protein LOC132719015 n=1 Tax=Ruditapes philippinarum TaxID=129788 RepID=UPI00295AE10F
MSTIDNERYMRYILLLSEGGTLVLKETLKMETIKASKPLDDLLKANETTLKMKMDRYTFKKLFGSSGNQDVDTWDISLLATVILHLFDNSITQDLKDCIIFLKDLRNKIAHAASMSLNADEYDKHRKDLAAVILKLCVGLDRMVHDKCQNLIKSSAAGPIETLSAINKVEELRKCDKDVCTILESLLSEMSTELKDVSDSVATMSTEMKGISDKVRASTTQMMDVSTKVECNSSKLEDISCKVKVLINEVTEIKQQMQKREAQHKCFESQELRTEITLEGPNDHITKMTEESVTGLFNSILAKADDGYLQKVGNALRSILSDMENCRGVKVIEVEYKCILIKLRCNNCEGLLKLLEYLESSLLEQRLLELSRALEETYKERFFVTFKIAPDDLKNILLNFKDNCQEKGYSGHDEVNADVNMDASTTVIEFESPQEKPLDMADIESRLREYRHEFEKCLKDPSIVSHLLAESVITDVDASRIKNLYIDKESVKASQELLDAVFTSEAPGKWRSFVDSLESAEYPYLKELLSYQKRYDAFSSSRAQKILCLFTPYLEQMIRAQEFVSELKTRGVINAADEEIILKTYETKGDIYSTMLLLDRMQCRKSPNDWYYEFLDLLMKKKCKHIVKEMEPDFIDNPSAFMPKLDTIISNKKEETMVSQRKEFEEEQGAYGSLHEHFVEDRGEGYEDTNDLGAPSLPTMRQDSPLTSTEYHIDSLQTNLKELNIKPDMTKSLSI